ncbi:MAG: hypothetical protein JEY79_15330 [Pseudodesulfovibrio sp.]|jgi:hypothetical protein|nr:hypothetical protein [Pseudodesulfovibrio sp.]
MQIEIGHLTVAVLAAIGLGALLYWRQRRTMSIPKIIFSMIGATFAIYYILYVVLGKGRTGWP